MNATFDESDRPPAGTECRRCRERFQHFCPATGYMGDRPACSDCGHGRKCAAVKAIKARLGPEMEIGSKGADDLLGPRSEARTVPRSEWKESEVIVQSTTAIQDDMAVRGRGVAIPDGVKSAILGEPITITNIDLAEKYRVSVGFVGKIRRAAGIITPGMHGIVENRGKKKEPDNRVNNGRKPGHPFKVVERAAAEKMLRSGSSVRDTMKVVGVARRTVQSVRKLIPASELPTPSIGGYREHRSMRDEHAPDPNNPPSTNAESAPEPPATSENPPSNQEEKQESSPGFVVVADAPPIHLATTPDTYQGLLDLAREDKAETEAKIVALAEEMGVLAKRKNHLQALIDVVSKMIE